MTPPRQIYASSLSRRERGWRKPRRRGGSLLLLLAARLTVTAVLAMTLALLVLPKV